MSSYDFSTWLCSINKTLIHSKTNGTIQIDRCITDTMIIFLHAVFIVIILLQLTILQYWRHIQKIPSPDIYLRYPGHSLRWILAFFVILIGAASFAEGLLTECIYRASDFLNAQPHFYLPGIFTISGTVMAMISVNFAEVWRFKQMFWTLLCYWTSSLVTVFIVLYFDIKVHMSLEVQRTISMNIVVLTLLSLCYTLLVLVEALSLHKIVFCGRSKRQAADNGMQFLPKEPWAKRRMFYRENYSNLPSQLLFWWLNFLFSIGFKRPINYERLGTIPVNHTIEYIYKRFKMIYDDEKKRIMGSDRRPSLMRTIFRAHWKRLGAAGLLKLIADLLSYVGPYALGGITLYVTRTLKGDRHKERTALDKPLPHDVTTAEFFSNGFVLVFIVFASSIVQHICNQTYYYWVNVEGLHAKSAIQMLVYNKSLRLSTATMSGGKMSMGQVTNHMSADASNVLFFFLNVNEIWAIPVKISVALYLLYQKLGMAAIIAASVFLVVIPLQMIVATTMAKMTKSVLKTSDKRLSASNEMLQGIRLLKIYGWEDIFYERVKTIRNSEIYQLLKIYILFAVTFSINSGTPIIVTLIAFAVYTPFNSTPLTPDRAFSSLALFKLITEPLFLLPYVLNLAVTMNVSVKRLVEFLGSPEVQPIDDRKVQGSNQPSGRRGDDDILGRCRSDERVVKSTPLWSVLEADEDLASEDDVFLTLEEMEQRNVVRQEMATTTHNQSGQKVLTNGDCVDGLQRDPLQQDLPDDTALRITNGSFVWDVTSSSSDVHDVSNVDITIPSGKLTIIVGAVGSGKSSLLGALMGEMTSCSGTVQIHKKKCRMAYAPQKAWLVNTTVRKNILFGQKMDKLRYQEVIQACSLGPDMEVLPAKDRTEIGENGINLSGGQKQRVSVARAMYSDCDIIILDDPLSALDMQVGSDLFDKGIKGILHRRNQTVILVTHQLQYLPQADKIIIMENGRVEHQGSPYEIARANQDLEVKWEEAVRRASETEDVRNSGSDTEMERKSLRRQCSRKMSVFSNSESFIEDRRGRLIAQEDRESGAVAMSNYIHYVSSMGYTLCVLIFCSTFLRGALQIVTDFWLSKWSETGLNGTHHDDNEIHQTSFYVKGFAGLSVGTLVSQILFNFLVNVGILLAAKTLHFEMLENLLMSPVRFFDVTPVGRILNRLSSDTRLIDQRLLITINMLMNSFVNMLASIVVNAVVNPVFLGILVPIAVIFVIIFIYYIRTSRELQRIESISRSPVLAHFSETLGGLATIRAFNEEARFSLAITEHINTNITAFLYLIAAQRWIGIRLDFLGAVVVLVAGYCSLLGASYFDIDASRVGLAISYSLMVSMYLNSLVRYCSELELHMNAVERVRFYSEVPNECYDEGQMPPSNWPRRGKILVDNVSARYAKELDPILHEVNINIQPGQKIGICGRSGSGKSSLALALFRFVQIKGRLLIDGIDIATVPLRTLRQRLSIIPQEAMMFTGTIRSNLDPRNTCTDEELWRSLEISQMKDTVEQLDKGLDSDVLEGGQNFSVGQRQLFCLARAFLIKSHILVMDEATASIDKETDMIIQEVVEEVFRERTVLTIAHRIDTLLNADYILTLDEGRVAEFDTPKNLLNKNSIFASLLQVGKK
ncbi:ATP-binding cassette sub-family C member 9-like isoform X1 [Lytechinus variegatus]|uniref:ATP-binding cassette sub-family C member 9-like isoform X1 n=1 Tax=Lytechinus variegatus TaxID=7654 RepID=UPI001BB11FB1|nr:ATP-binding cassette sub-family C member 9-like isoform X1 [Lytechinus variegatus]